MTWMLFSSAVMSQIIVSNDHHFKGQHYTPPLVHIDFMYRLMLTFYYYDQIEFKYSRNTAGKCTALNTTPIGEQNKTFSLSFD